jgi:hypothetical protein
MKSNSFKLLLACTLYWIGSNLFAQQPTMNQLVGINVKPQENLQGATRFSTIRSWHLFEDDISQGGGDGNGCPFDAGDPKLRWNPSYNGNKLIRYDDYYRAAPQRFIPVLHGNAPMMYPGINVECENLTVVPTPTGIQVSGLTAPSCRIQVFSATNLLEDDIQLTTQPPGLRYFVSKTFTNTVSKKVRVVQFNRAGAEVCNKEIPVTLVPQSSRYVTIDDQTVQEENISGVTGIDAFLGIDLAGWPVFQITFKADFPPGTTVQSLPIKVNYDIIHKSTNSFLDLYAKRDPNDPTIRLEAYPTTGTVIIPANVNSVTVQVPLDNDVVFEPTELLLIKIKSVTNATIGKEIGTITITDGDNPSSTRFAKAICPDVFPSLALQSQPESWLPLTQWASTFAARYGSPPVGGYPNNFAQILEQRFVTAPDNQGLGKATIQYLEIANETDNSWVEGLDVNVTGTGLDNNPSIASAYYYRPREYAALLSAAYDGHQNNPAFEIRNTAGQPTGKRWGIKNLSSNTKLVMAGVADLRKDYLDLMVNQWTILRPDGSIPIDVVNYHFYSTKSHPAIDQGNWKEFFEGRRTFSNLDGGQFPEADNINLRDRILKTMDNQHPKLRTKPVWVTEFGYDSDASKVSGIRVASQTQQAQWLTRYILECSAVKSTDGRFIEKLHIYELNDDPTQAQFGSSGLQGKFGYKKSWYHVRTMLAVLSATKFKEKNDGDDEKRHIFVSGGNNLPADKPRIYSYERVLGKPILALWMPTGNGLSVSGTIKISKSRLDQPINQPKPKIQLIEVVDGDEDGKRTLINPAFIIDAGQHWEITHFKMANDVITITETPIYLRINQGNGGNMGSDPVVPEIVNLSAGCLGCPATGQVSWQKPSGANYSFYRVYRSNDCNQNTFDIEQMELVAHQLPGAATSAIINNITVTGANPCTKIWVVPFVGVLNGETYTYVMGTPISVNYVPANCPAQQQQHCGSQVSPTNVQGTGSGNLSSLLNPNSQMGTDVCNDIAANISLAADYSVFSGQSVSFEMNFGTPQILNNLNLFYASGTGQIKIEIQEDCCANFTSTQLIQLQYLDQGPRWINFANQITNIKRIQRMRITITGLPATGITLRKLLFCLTPATDVCPGLDQKTTTIAPIQTPESIEVNTHSAVVKWNTTVHSKDGEAPEPVGGYILKYSTQRNSKGELVQPETLQIDGVPFDGGSNEVPLTPLVPNTTYYVDVLPDPTTIPCVAYPTQPAQLNFTTLAVPEEITEGRLQSSNAEFVEQPPLMTLFPNPTSQKLHIQLEKAGLYTDFIVHSVSGYRKMEGKLDDKAQLQQIDLPKLNPGLYILTLIGDHVRPQSKTFIVVNED